MNTVILLMYLADVSTSLSAVLVIMGIVVSIVWVVRWMAAATDDVGIGAWKRTMPRGIFLWMVCGCWLISSLLPGRATLYAAAAVQAGDTFAQTERGEKVLRALDHWLTEQTKDK